MEKGSKHSKTARFTKDNFKMVSDMEKEDSKIMTVDKLMVLFNKGKCMDMQMRKISHIPIQDNGRRVKWMALEKANGKWNSQKHNILENTKLDKKMDSVSTEINKGYLKEAGLMDK